MGFHAVGDFDGDGIWEAAALSRRQDGFWLTAYKHLGWGWVETGQWRWPEIAVHAFYAVPAALDGRRGHHLAVGWEWESRASFSVLDWSTGVPAERARYALNPDGRAEALAFRAAGLYPATVNTTSGQFWGYVDEKGRMRLPPVYEYADSFQENGLAIVSIRGKSGIIDTRGQFVVEPKYDGIQPFSEGRAVVSDINGAFVIDERGQRVTPPGKWYSYIQPFSDGRALFYQSGDGGNALYGYLDLEGREAIPASFLEGSDFRNGKAVVKVKNGLYRLIGRSGESLAELPFAFVGPLSEGLMAYQATDGGRYGYLNERGSVAIAPAYTGAQPFRDGRAVVNTAEDFGNKYGLIDMGGRLTVPAGYADIRLLGQHRAALGKAVDPARPYIGSRFAIADLDGKLLSDFVYGDVEDFNRGHASVQDGRNTFFIGPDGKRAPNLPVLAGTGSLAFEGNLIRAQVDNRLSYLTPSGQVVWSQNTVIPLTPPYRVRELKYKPNKDYLVYYPQVEGMTPPAAQDEVNRRLAELSKIKPIPPDQQLESSYTGDFQVVFYRGRLLQLLLEGYDYPFGAAHGMPSRVYPPVDLGSGRFYKLEDLFKPGSDYLKVLSAIVKKQIDSGAYPYVWPDSYKGISADQLFYVTADALHLLFAPYEIAPYAAGFPDFAVPYAELDDILDKKGAFWRSFHPPVEGR